MTSTRIAARSRPPRGPAWPTRAAAFAGRPPTLRRAPRARPRARCSRASRCPGWSSGRARSRPTSSPRRARHFRCVDGHDYVDFCLGDTGAMAGHGPAPTIAAVERQLRLRHHPHAPDRGRRVGRRGADAPVRARRSWQFALSATDANRLSLRLARHITGRSKVVVHDHCYHGSVDEAIAMLGADGRVVPGPRLGRAAGRRRADDPRRRVQRRRRPGGRARRSRRRRRPHRAGADQRRDRPARARLPRRRARDDPPDRHAPHHRRDPHHLRRPGRRHRAVGPRARHAGDRQDDRRRHPGRPPTGSRTRSATRIHALDRGRRTRTSAGSAARSPATRCRWPRRGRPWARS